MALFRGVQKALRVLIRVDAKAVTQSARSQLTRDEPSHGPVSLLFDVPRKLLSRIVAQQSVMTTSFASALRRTASLRIISGRCANFSYLLAFAPLALAGNQEDKGKKSLAALQFIDNGINILKAQNEYRVTPTKSSDLVFENRLGKPSSCAAVYSAKYGQKEVAVKMMFNYYFASNAQEISKGFKKEAALLCPSVNVPKTCVVKDIEPLSNHPNIVRAHTYFVDDMPVLDDAKSSYPFALPCHSGGGAHNKTLFLVMNKYSQTLGDFAASGSQPSEKELMLLFAQLLEGLAFLRQNNVSHADLKGENVLLMKKEGDYPKLAITDFGMAVSDPRFGLRIPYETDRVSKGGNIAYMAPEIKNAKPGCGRYLDFDKADVWGAGALAYKIFGQDIPLSATGSFSFGDTKPLLGGKIPLVDKLIKLMLQEDPRLRVSASVAATYLNLLLFRPEICKLGEFLPYKFVERWIESTRDDATLQLWDKSSKGKELMVEFEHWLTFLKRTTPDEIMEALKLMRSTDDM